MATGQGLEMTAVMPDTQTLEQLAGSNDFVRELARATWQVPTAFANTQKTVVAVIRPNSVATSTREMTNPKGRIKKVSGFLVLDLAANTFLGGVNIAVKETDEAKFVITGLFAIADPPNFAGQEGVYFIVVFGN